MTAERKRQLATLLTLALLAAVAVLRTRGSRGAVSEPRDTIYAMLDAARAGDVRAYLAQYTGPMEASLRQSIAESSPAAFARYLRERNAQIRGVALGPARSESPGTASIRVEYVYVGGNETQTVLLRKTAGNWKIARLDAAERVPAAVPYGTPVE